jgi:hypothetical protein
MRLRRRSLNLPILIAIAGTRAMLGAGAGLLLAPRLPERRRRVVGLTLLGVGIASTLPLASFVVGRLR